MATTSDFRNGLCFIYQGAVHMIVSMQHVKPGKGGAYYRTKMRHLESGKLVEHTFSVGVKIQTAHIEQRAAQLLYKDHAGYHFMDSALFETTTLPETKINAPQFLREGAHVSLLYYAEADRVLGAELPPLVTLSVAYAEPAVKGNTVNRALKKVTLETGVALMVPLFIEEGDQVKVDTRTGHYVERSKVSKDHIN